MTAVASYLRAWAADVLSGWNRFWFRPADPASLGLIRICTGAMLLYTHLVWSLDLGAFFGAHSWLPRAAVSALQENTYSWSYLWWLEDSPLALWSAHVAALGVFLFLTIGLFSRVASVLSLVAALSYVGRVPGALFGLDQINVLLAMYLAVGPCGDAFSIDRWLASRRAGVPLPIRASWTANLAIRLIQVHLCMIYWFAGTAKLTGPGWWDGTALWMALGNMEYQSLDMTWLADWPWLINLMTHVTIFWEISYSALIWPRLTRPVMLLLAIPLHMGIAICLGMVTFGLIMLVANLAFVPPEALRVFLPGAGKGGREHSTEQKSTGLKAARPSGSASASRR